jgi:hypothetical protein
MMRKRLWVSSNPRMDLMLRKFTSSHSRMIEWKAGFDIQYLQPDGVEVCFFSDLVNGGQYRTVRKYRDQVEDALVCAATEHYSSAHAHCMREARRWWGNTMQSCMEMSCRRLSRWSQAVRTLSEWHCKASRQSNGVWSDPPTLSSAWKSLDFSHLPRLQHPASEWCRSRRASSGLGEIWNNRIEVIIIAFIVFYD